MRRAFAQFEFYFVIGLFFVVLAVTFPVLARFRENARRSKCQANIKQIGLAFLQYVRDNDGSFPSSRISTANGWAGSLQPYLKSTLIFQCPKNNRGIRGEISLNLIDYFYNGRLSELKMKKVSDPSITILSGDGNFDAPLSTSISALPQGWRDYEGAPANRHLLGANYAFVDGHVKWLKPEKVMLESPKNWTISTFLPQ